MYFDFDERYVQVEPVGGAVTRRDGVLLSVVVHAAIVGLLMVLPSLDILPSRQPPVAAEQPKEPDQEAPQFVFVAPQVDIEAEEAPPRAEASDMDRTARAVEVPPVEPESPLPFARGNSAERVEAAPELRARGEGPAREPAPDTPPVPAPEPERDRPSESEMAMARTAPPPQPPQPPPGGALGDALQNLQKYIDQESFNNPNGQMQDMGPLQFDTKGVEFGPWIRRFIAQVRRNWFIPYSAMAMQGRVVLQFNVHKNGRITDLAVVGPSGVDSFNTAAFNALSASDPTTPLPPEYPDDKAFFTVTFYYNETPEGPR